MKNELKVLRASRQMTQQQLAQQVGVSRQTIHAFSGSASRRRTE